VSRKGNQTEISLIAVDEAGAVAAPQKVVRTTPNRVLAVQADSRSGVEPTFVVLEADPAKPDHVGLVRISRAGEYRTSDGKEPELKPAPGWPAVKDGDKMRLLRSAEAALEVAVDGESWIALTDEHGSLYQGHGELPSFELLRQGSETARCLHPHIGSLAEGVTVSCFTETGNLFHAGEHGGH
jgi:hypothetical protein